MSSVVNGISKAIAGCHIHGIRVPWVNSDIGYGKVGQVISISAPVQAAVCAPPQSSRCGSRPHDLRVSGFKNNAVYPARASPDWGLFWANVVPRAHWI